MSIVLILDHSDDLSSVIDNIALRVDAKLAARINQMSDDLKAELGQAITDLRTAVGGAVADIKAQADALAAAASSGGAMPSSVVLDAVNQIHGLTDALNAAVAPTSQTQPTGTAAGASDAAGTANAETDQTA